MSSFLGKPDEFQDLSPRMMVVSRLHASDEGIAEIFLGERMGKKFILKSLKENLKADPVYSHLLRKEFEIGFSLSHPGVAKTLSLEEIEGIGAAIVEEYIPGKTLSSLIQSGSLLNGKPAEIMKELIGTLAYIHQNQTVHNDLKPSNIIISDFDGKPKIIDFGFADSPGYTSMKFNGGTAEYVAPERLRGEATGDPRNDVWSLGIIARKLAPFAGNDRKKLLKIAEKCCVPFSQREQEVKKLLPLLDKNDNGKQRIFYWILFIAAALFLIFSRGKFRDEDNTRNSVSGEGQKVVKETPLPTEMPEEDAPTNDETPAEISLDQSSQAPSPKLSPESPARESAEPSEVSLHAEALSEQYNEAETEIYYTLARNYALRLTEEMITKRKAEGKFHQHETREQLLESRYEYEKLMQSIADYVETIGIPSESLQSEVIKDAQKAATDLIHQEAARRDGLSN